jgi:hypothetical protein
MPRDLLIAWSTVVLNTTLAVLIARWQARESYQRGFTAGRLYAATRRAKKEF